ncbi:MAG: folylpolyglutamate synthase/dihydrofolate synthase family protein [Candidatus Promineifilaceae bacterium]|nr:folylpolyglutamate synthase/dihydrofolate synthase family protein [Candidatus Promineifilaceae bacterium]
MKKERLSTVDQAYEEALDFLYGFINLEKNTLDRYHASKMDTERPRHLCGLLGDPHLKYPTIHIAGTKGKGSVAAMCAAVLSSAGLRVGLYTSPHLREFRERIRIVSSADPIGLIDKADFVEQLNKIRPLLHSVQEVTWFEIVTAVAFQYFAAEQVDVAIIEVGLGGRLDATNVIEPLVAVITSLSLDHTNLLGNSLSEIAYEKGGIIKPGVPLVSASQPGEALLKLKEIALSRECPITVVGQNWQFDGRSHDLTITRSGNEAFIPSGTSFKLALAGEHQLENATVAVATLSIVRSHFADVGIEVLRQGLAEVQWDGRLQVVYEGDGQPTFLVDTAHNEDSASKLEAALTHDYEYRRLWLLFGAPTDKAIDQMMVLLFPLAEGVIVSSAEHPRAAPPYELASRARALGFETIEIDDVDLALYEAFRLAEPGDLICATGSIIFVGDLLNRWDVLQSQLVG